MSVGPGVVDPVSVDPVSVDSVSVGPVSVDPVSVDSVSVDPVSVDPVSVDSVSVDSVVRGLGVGGLGVGRLGVGRLVSVDSVSVDSVSVDSVSVDSVSGGLRSVDSVSVDPVSVDSVSVDSGAPWTRCRSTPCPWTRCRSTGVRGLGVGRPGVRGLGVRRLRVGGLRAGRVGRAGHRREAVVADVLPAGVADRHRLRRRVDLDVHRPVTVVRGTGLDAVAVDQLALGSGDHDLGLAAGDVDLAGVESLADLAAPSAPVAKLGAPAETSRAPPKRVAVTAVAAASRRRVFVGEVTRARCPIPAADTCLAGNLREGRTTPEGRVGRGCGAASQSAPVSIRAYRTAPSRPCSTNTKRRCRGPRAPTTRRPRSAWSRPRTTRARGRGRRPRRRAGRGVVVGQPLRHRPRAEHTVLLEPEVVVATRGVVLVQHEHRPAGHVLPPAWSRSAGRRASSPRQRAPSRRQ